MPFVVYLLWFTEIDPNSNNAFHWALFIAPAENHLIGFKYDVRRDNNGNWTSQPMRYQMRQSRRLGGVFFLGSINDANPLIQIMTATPLPVEGENCQTWVWKVVIRAVELGILPNTALAQLALVPVRRT